MKSKEIKNLIKEIAFETGESLHDVEMAIRSEFRFVHDIAQTTTEPVRLIYFGVFGVKETRRRKVAEKNERQRQKKNGTI